jgi:RHS repeat-associated protein
VIKEEFMGEIKVKDDSNFTYSRQLDVTRLATANNQTVNLSFDYENTPPFAISNYSVAAVDGSNPLGLINGTFDVTSAITGEIGGISKDGTPLYTKTYDPAGRLTGVNSSFAGQSYTATIIRDALGRKTNVNHSTGINGVYGYDLLNRVTNISWLGNGENFSQDIAYNAATGNIDQIIRELGTFTYNHDSLDQLTGVDFSGTPNLGNLVTNRTMDYDKAGNRTNDSVYGVTKNRRNTILNNEQWTYYTDRNGLGDIIQKSNETEAHLFEYRGDKKLKKFTLLKNNTETSVDYYYDALGRRVAKSINTPTESFTNTFAYEADQDKILLGKNGNGDETLYIDGQGIDEHLAEVNSNGIKAYLVNHLGTVLNSGATDSARATGAFGEVLQSVNTISSSAEPVSYGFTGQEFDLESKSYYYDSRQYDPEAGKFNSQDVIGLAGGDTNLGRYVFNNPTIYSDPSGNFLFIPIIAGAVSGAVGGYISGGDLQSAAIGAAVGAITGLIPGSIAFQGALASTLGQFSGNIVNIANDRADRGFNFGAIAGAGIGGGLAGRLFGSGARTTIFSSSISRATIFADTAGGAITQGLAEGTIIGLSELLGGSFSSDSKGLVCK